MTTLSSPNDIAYVADLESVVALAGRYNPLAPIKRLLSTAKTFPMTEKEFFSPLVAIIAVVTIAVISFITMSALLHQSPIRIKAIRPK